MHNSYLGEIAKVRSYNLIRRLIKYDHILNINKNIKFVLLYIYCYTT